MCDIYSHPCKGCGKDLYMHLGDYDTDSSEIDVFCDQCLPEDRANGILWVTLSDEEAEFVGGSHKIFVRWLTPNAKANRYSNHPNEGHDPEGGYPDGQ